MGNSADRATSGLSPDDSRLPENGGPEFLSNRNREELRAESVKQYNLGHANGLRAAHTGERFDVEATHPSYHRGLADGLYSEPHPGPGAV